MQPRCHAAGLVADAIEARKKRRQRAKDDTGISRDAPSNTTEPSRLLTTQTAVLDMDVSSAAESFMAGRPLRRIRIDPPPCCDNDGECAASCSSPITPPFLIGRSKSTLNYAISQLFAHGHFLSLCTDCGQSPPVNAQAVCILQAGSMRSFAFGTWPSHALHQVHKQ